ncbi:hypothetical protein JCM10449v2_004630 [Rhodotorula kratochvilovae]
MQSAEPLTEEQSNPGRALRPKKAHPDAVADQAAEVGDEGIDEAKKDEAPSPKRAKKGKKRFVPTGTDYFSSLPLDVLHQICGQLDPGSLLSIAQSSKAVHKTLYNRASAPVWLAARRAVGLQDLEEEMDEPKYAWLVQGKACEICGSSARSTETDHYLRIRACSEDLRANLHIESWIVKKHPGLHAKTFECALDTEFSARGESRRDGELYYWVPEALAVSQELYALEPPSTSTGEPADGSSNETNLTGKADTPLEEYVRTRQELKRRILDDAEQIFKWEMMDLNESLEEVARKKRERRREIEFKLEALGYTKADYEFRGYGSNWVVARAFDSTKQLSDREWKTLYPKLKSRLDQVREGRLHRERLEAQFQRRKQLAPLYQQVRLTLSHAAQRTFIPFNDFRDLPTVRKLWLPDDAVIDPSKWPALDPAIRREAERFDRDEKVKRFYEVGRKLLAAGVKLGRPISRLLEESSAQGGRPSAAKKESVPTVSPSDVQLDSVLSLAVALFDCGFCHRKFASEDVLFHTRCACRWSSASTSGVAPASGYDLGLVRGMLRDAGLDETTATHEDLDQLGAVFSHTSKDGRVFSGETWKEFRAFVYVPVDGLWGSPDGHITSLSITKSTGHGGLSSASK